MKFKIYNEPAYAKTFEFIVCSVSSNGEYWFYGAFSDSAKADCIAAKIKGVVIYNVVKGD